MQEPEQIQPRGLSDYLSVMSKSVFQSDMSWRVIESKWPGINEAMRGFDPAALTALTAAHMEALEKDTQVIRNCKKLEAIVENAQTMQDLEQQHGSFRAYLRSHGDFVATAKDLGLPRFGGQIS